VAQTQTLAEALSVGQEQTGKILGAQASKITVASAGIFSKKNIAII